MTRYVTNRRGTHFPGRTHRTPRIDCRVVDHDGGGREGETHNDVHNAE